MGRASSNTRGKPVAVENSRWGHQLVAFSCIVGCYHKSLGSDSGRRVLFFVNERRMELRCEVNSGTLTHKP